MVAATVFNQLVTTLQGNGTLSGYVKYVYKGNRYNIEPDSMPCIMCEVTGNNEIELDANQIKKIWLDVDVTAITKSSDNPDYAIVGGAGYQGVLDIENDIRACLQSSYTLADNVIDVRFEPTEFQDFEIKRFMARALRIPMRILYRQTDGV